MMTNKIQLKTKNLDITKFEFDEPTKNKNNGQIVYLKYAGDIPILQTPWLKAPYGLYDIVDDANIRRVKLTTTFHNHENDPEIQTFMEKMKEFDEYICEYATKNSKKWFGNTKKKEIIDEYYRKLVVPGNEKKKDPKNPDSEFLTDENGNTLFWEPSFAAVKFYVDQNQNKIQVRCTDQDKNWFDITKLPKQTKVRMLLNPTSIWFIGKQKFGITFSCTEIQVDCQNLPHQISFDDSDSDDDSEEED